MKTGASAFGSVGLAMLAHIPCCGPSVLFAVGGASASAGWLHALEAYRPLFIWLSVASLAVGFWSAYRKPHACHDCGTCDSENHSQRRVKIGSMWFVASLVAVLTVVSLINGQHVHQ